MNITKLDSWRYEVAVNDVPYEFGKWGVEESLDVLYDITALVGGPAGQALSMAFGKGKAGLDTEITGDMASEVFSSFAGNMRAHKSVVMRIIKKLAAEDVLCQGRKVVFEQHYKDNLGLLFQVARAGFEVQYGSFFADALGKLGLSQAGAGMTGPDTAPATTT